ncbi:PLC-like phosphodiesterase [Mycena galopus ATCC 62051]|nr:PLC-like phosphodiesterase [Mycena galopus ATCC 62051]
MTEAKRNLPECWGHRGASARFPENTMASFEAAIRDGVDGIESDVHISKDGVVIMFHDPTLKRTTNYTGVIKDCNWYGPDGMQHARTKKEPAQSIPTFPETLSLLMKVHSNPARKSPRAFRLDIKPTNDPVKLFEMMHAAISAFPQWETLDILPYCQMGCISFSTWIIRQYLWDDVDCISIWYNALVSSEGQRFREDVKKAGKKLMVFTVNKPEHLAEVVRWQVDAIITDVPNQYLQLRSGLEKNYESTMIQSSRLFLWTTFTMWWPFTYGIQSFSRYCQSLVVHVLYTDVSQYFLKTRGGPLVAIAR